MLTDTQWLLNALVGELSNAKVADTVATFNGVDIEEALRLLVKYPRTAILVMPDQLTLDHDIQSGVCVKAMITRKVNLFLASSAPGKSGGDMAEANTMVDRVIEHLMWHTLGQPGRVIVKPRSAMPQEVVFDDTPGRAIWSMQVDVTCLENNF